MAKVTWALSERFRMETEAFELQSRCQGPEGVSVPGVCKLPEKGQLVNTLGFVGHVVSATTHQCCFGSPKAANDNM